jgi:hypothetical protein
VPDVVKRHVGPLAVWFAAVFPSIRQKYVTPVGNPETM